MDKIWFTSDTHFGSERVRELSKRPFKTVEEMDNTIINNWNQIVEQNDIVYHLGDFGDYSKVQKLNGKIILIVGNYELNGYSDMSSMEIYRDLQNKYAFYKVDGWGIRDIGNNTFNLCHEPKDSIPGRFNLFGHIHKLQMVKRFGLNVGIDCHNYFPIDLETILFYKNSIEYVYDDNVFM